MASRVRFKEKNWQIYFSNIKKVKIERKIQMASVTREKHREGKVNRWSLGRGGRDQSLVIL
jgi:hypothetical protein